MAMSTPGWQKVLLAKLGAPATAENLKFLNAWQQAEGGGASNNPFNTTQPAAGATSYNSNGGNPVKNYPSYQEGVNATIQTLLNGHYGNIVSGLRSGKASAAQLGTAVAESPWGTGSGVLRVLGSKPVNAAWGTPGGSTGGKAGQGQSGLPPIGTGMTPGMTPDLFKQLLGQQLLQNSQQAMNGNIAGAGNGLLQMVAMRNALQTASASGMSNASAPAAAHAATHGAGTLNAPVKTLDGSYQMQVGGKSPYSNLRFDAGTDWMHVNPRLLKTINTVASTHGVVIDINSGYRSNQHSLQVGGFPGDPHTRGIAIDGYVNGKPVGSVIPTDTWTKYGVKSGNVPNFYDGKPDPEHLQLGA